MKNLQIRFVLSVTAMLSVLMTVTTAFAGPVRFDQVVQIINAKPGKANTAGFSQLRLVNGEFVADGDDKKDGDDKTKKTPAPQQDDRVIIETTSEIVEDDVCDCDQPDIATSKFPYWALLGFAAVPLLFLIPRKDRTPNPTPDFPTPPTSPTPPMSPTPPTSPTPTVTPTPTMTPTPTPTMTPTMSPTPPDAVPEPMTLLLFGTGLASIGLAARKKFGRKDDEEIEG